MPDACGFEVSSRFTIDGDAHFFSDGFNDEEVGFSRLKLCGIGDAVRGDNFVDLGFIGGHVFFEFDDPSVLGAFALIQDSHAVELRLGSADVSVMGARVLTVIEFDIDHRGAIETNLGLYNAVFGWEV